MASQLKLRRGTTAQHSTFTGASGEVTVDTTKKTLVVHDGTTAGGIPLVPTTDVSTSGGASKILKTDASGNLGLGVTPSAWGNSVALQTLNSFSYSSFGVLQNGYYNGTNWIYSNTNAASRYTQSGGYHIWYNAPSGTAGDAITFTQAMTLDASGNLGVGTTSPSTRLQVNSSAGAISRFVGNNSNNYVEISDNNGSSFASFGAISGGNSYSYTAGYHAIYAGGSERARIDSSGNLLVGKTSSDLSTPGFGVDIRSGVLNGVSIIKNDGNWGTALFIRRNSGAGTGAVAEFNYNGTTTGTIGITATNTAYNTSSDYRLKDNVQPMTGALAKVQQLKPCTYRWKADGSDGEGFIAHELQAVVPQCVTGEKDAVDAEGKPVYQGIDTSFLVATLTAAIQEQQAIIDAQASALQTLTARIEALEAK